MCQPGADGVFTAVGFSRVNSQRLLARSLKTESTL